MKRKLSLLVLAIALVFSHVMITSGEPLSTQRQNEINDHFNALWVATVLNLDYPSKPTSDSVTLKAEALSIIEEAHAMGINAIVLQVRPSADAFYKSSIYPWSKYLTGKQGLAPSDGFDPLEFWINESHKRGIAVHAWINPYRITRKTSTEPAHDFASLSTNHPAKLNPSWVVSHTDGNLYFNPGIPEVIDHISESVLEIVKNYDVDGIHFDDYFYPSTTFDDAAAYAKYGKAFASIADWRRYNVDTLVERVYKAIKNEDASVAFGISPFGIWANAKKNPLGSATNGFESYYSQYADTKKWVENNMIDYIAPQIYWHIGYDIADYSVLVKWWSDVVKNSDVKLYIGHAAYRTYNTDASSPWYGISELDRQLRLNRSYDTIKGSIFFRYSFFKNKTELKSLVKNSFERPDSTQTQTQLIIGRPYKDVSTTSAFYFIGGASDINHPLFINGEEVIARSPNGYFGVYVPLKMGINTFSIAQNGQRYTRQITRKTAALAPPMSKVEIVQGSTWPQSVRAYQNGETITFSCRAPIGAQVNVTLDGKTYALTPATKTSSATKPYATTFSYKAVLPVYTGTPRVINLGKPVYTMTYNGTRYSETAKGDIKVIMPNAPYVARVSKNFVDSYETASTSNGAHHILHLGMKDYVVGEIGDLVKLSSSLWVKRENLTLSTGQLKQNAVRSITHNIGSDSEEVAFYITENVIKSASLNDGKLHVTFNQTFSGVDAFIKAESMIASTSKNQTDNTLTYTFVLKDLSDLGGYYIEDITGGIKLVVRKKFKSVDVKPLSGATIMLDAGHGGSDNGAIGLLGTFRPEKSIVFDVTDKLRASLESQGATVIMTRVGDAYVHLSKRLSDSRSTLPDLFISIHADSYEDTADLTKISGFTVFYKDQLAKPIANRFRDDIANNLFRRNRGAKYMNLYVTRGTWTPSVLIELGFVSNPLEFDWMSDPYEQDRFAETLTNSIVKYFKGN